MTWPYWAWVASDSATAIVHGFEMGRVDRDALGVVGADARLQRRDGHRVRRAGREASAERRRVGRAGVTDDLEAHAHLGGASTISLVARSDRVAARVGVAALGHRVEVGVW